MSRLTGTLVATLLVGAGPWGGCDRDPVAPPAAPPTERAPFDAVELPDSGGVILLDPARRRG